MKMTNALAFAALLSLVACAAPGEAGDPCTTDEDCAEGLECHDHHAHEEGEHEEGEEEEGEHEEGEEEGGVCEDPAAEAE